jgi:hypothetical protein
MGGKYVKINLKNREKRTGLVHQDINNLLICSYSYDLSRDAISVSEYRLTASSRRRTCE